MICAERQDQIAQTFNHATAPQSYVYGRYKARILPDGSIGYYREVYTPDGGDLIGTEYPNEDYCWFNLSKSAVQAGLTHDEIFDEEQSPSDLLFNVREIEALRSESGVLG